MKKHLLFLAVILAALCLLLPATAIATQAETSYEAQIGDTPYEHLSDAIAQGGEITLLADIDLSTAIEVKTTVTLNLNGKTLTVTKDTAGDGVFHVTAGGDMTINGNGTINGVGENDYNMAIWADGGKVTINGGIYTNAGATADSDPAHMDLIYVKNGGIVTINGGTFIDETPAWTLNSHDTLKGTIAVTGGTFKGFNPADCATEGAGTNFVAEGYKSNEGTNGTWFVQAEYVADVNGVQYGTVAEAIAAANNGDTVTLLPVVIHEPIKPMAGDSQHKKEKDIIIHGFNSYTDPNGNDWGTYGETILTGGLYWGYDDGHTRSYSVEVSGITFQGKGLTVADEANVNISYNKFTDIVGDAIAVLDQEYDSMEGYAGVQYNRIEGATGAGINLRNPYVVDVQNNYIANTGSNSITIQKKDGNTDNIGYVEIQNNTLKNWAYNSTEGRALRAAFTGDATEKSICFRQNKLVRDGDAPEEYVKLTGLAETYYVDLDNNYWNGKNPGETGLVLADNTDCLNWYYEDADMQNSVQTYMAYISSNIGETSYYMTLKEAVDAAQDGDWVYLLRDASGSGIIIDKSIYIDFNRYTYTLTEPPVGSSGTETLGFQVKTGNNVIFQNGRLTVDKNYATNYAILIQNYANLTLTDMNLDGTNLDRHTIKDYDYSYVLSNNSGIVRLDGSTYITANDDGNAYAFDVCKYSSYDAPTVTVDTTGRIIGKIEVTSGLENNLIIENGTYSVNPSAYLPDYRIATLNNGLFYVADKPEDAPDVSVDIKAEDTVKEDIQIDTNAGIATEDVANVRQAVADAVNKEDTKQDLQNAANNLQHDSSVVGSTNDAHNALQEQDSANYNPEAEVEVQVKPYLDVTVKEYNTSNNTVKLDIKVLYDVVAVQKGTGNEVTASATLKEAQPMTNVSTAITITIPLPTGFANDGDTVYIYHTKSDGTLYIHEATVSVAGGATTATFVNDQGFSSFEVKTTKTELFDFYGANVDLGNTFNMNFYFQQSHIADKTGYYAQFVRKYANGSTETTKVYDDAWVANNSYWQITYAGINAKEMCDEVTVQIFDANGNAVSTVWTDSIQTYASRALNKPEATARDVKIIIGMLDFGALAQEYMGYNTLNPANAIVTTAHRNKAEQTV